MKLHEKSFLEPKLLESLNLSFRVQTDLNMCLDSNKSPIRKYSPSVLNANKAKNATASRSTVILWQLSNDPKIWSIILRFIGHKFSLNKILKQASEAYSTINNAPNRARYVSKSFAAESIADINALRQDYKVLQKEIKELERVESLLEREIRLYHSFLTSPFNVDYTRFLYLTTKLSYVRHASFPSRIKSTKNEYLSKLSELRKGLKQSVLKRTEEVCETIAFHKNTQSQSVSEMTQLLHDVRQAEERHWLELTSSNTTSVTEAKSKVQQEEDMISYVTEKLQRASLTAQQLIDDTFQAITQPAEISASTPQTSRRASKLKDDNSNANTQSQYLKLQLNQIETQSKSLLDSYSTELDGAMDKCYGMANDSIDRKHGSLAHTVASNASIARVVGRIEELRSMTQSFSKHQEMLREKLFDQHENSIAQMSTAILQRRMSFLNRIKTKFDALSIIAKESRMKQKHAEQSVRSTRSSNVSARNMGFM